MLNRLIRWCWFNKPNPYPKFKESGLASLPFVGVLFFADQVSKFLVSLSFDYAVPFQINEYLDVLLLHNQGAAFSFLSDAGGWQRWFFTAIAIGVSVVLLVLLRQHYWRENKLYTLSLIMILSGALGNVTDRLLFGYVVDFISLHYGDWYWPSFNIADSAISIGAVLFILDSFINRKQVPPQS